MVPKRLILLTAVAMAGCVAMQMTAAVVPAQAADRWGLCVMPIKQMPTPEVLSALQTVFGDDLTVTPKEEMNILILRGTESAVSRAVRTMKDSIDPAWFERGDEEDDEDEEGGPGIELVRLRRVPIETVVPLVKEVITGDLEVVERPAVKAVIFEGRRDLVWQAVHFAKQLDHQDMHPAVHRILRPEGEEGDEE